MSARQAMSRRREAESRPSQWTKGVEKPAKRHQIQVQTREERIGQHTCQLVCSAKFVMVMRTPLLRGRAAGLLPKTRSECAVYIADRDSGKPFAGCAIIRARSFSELHDQAFAHEVCWTIDTSAFRDEMLNQIPDLCH